MAKEALTNVQKAGDIEFLEISLYTADSEYEQQVSSVVKDGLDISLFVGEISLFEDMFGPGMTGSVLMLDAANLYENYNLKGNEWLVLKFRTPTMDDESALIYKRFKIYSITDRQMISDTGKQSYVLHFCSPEILIDIVSPIQKTYRGRVDETVRQIYARIAVPRTLGSNKLTELSINGPTANEITFVSPNWTPIQSINWLASRAQPANLKNPGYLFYESNKKYNFTNVEYIIDDAVRSGKYYQNYIHTPRKVNIPIEQQNRYLDNVDVDYKKVENLTILEDYNYLKNSQNGYYANRLYTLDVITKRYKHRDYDHVNAYKDYAHLGYIKPTADTPNVGGKDCKPFNENDTYNVLGHQNFYPQHSDLFTNVKNNAGDIIDKTMPLRISTLNELTNIKMEITVPGRTDVEVGKVVHLFYPSAEERAADSGAENQFDKRYTGFYLITAIRHKFTLLSHTMTLEIVKDSLGRAQV